MVRIDDGHIEKLIENADNPHFSPDGTRIAFQNNDNEIFIANADGTNPKRLSDEKDLELGGWSPDSNQILYSQSREEPDPSLLFIVTVNPAFDENQKFPKKKIRVPIQFLDETFGTNGKSILFSGHTGGKRWHIYRLYLENERLIQLTFGNFIDAYPREWRDPLLVSPQELTLTLWREIKTLSK